MKREKKTNLKSLLLVLLITLILLISASYAWFTANQTVSVNQLEVNVQTTSGLQISVDAVNWKSVITTSDLGQVAVAKKYANHVNQIATSMEPVSSAGTVTDGKLDIFYGIVEANDDTGKFDLTATQEVDTAGTSGKYIAFDIFLLVNDETDIALTSASKVVAVDDSKGLEYAARVAFLNEGNVEIGSDPADAQELSKATYSDVFIWEPNCDVHTTAGIQNAASVYGIDDLGASGEDPLPYVGIKKEFDISDEITIDTTASATDFFASVTPALSTNKSIDTNSYYITLPAGITKVRVYMWIEGEDVDCENSASGTDIAYNIQFTVMEKEDEGDETP